MTKLDGFEPHVRDRSRRLEAQRRVIAMRDIAGLGADEVRGALGLSAGNHRAPLQRSRSRSRAALEVHLDG